MNNTHWLSELMVGLAFASSMWAGVYLCTHDFPTLGGWVCILTLCCNWHTGS